MLTQAQRAKRRTHKINNRVSKELPLFAGTDAILPFLTTEEKQLAAVKRWDVICENFFSHLDQIDAEFLQKASQYRQELAGLVSAAELLALDQQVESLIAKWNAFKNNPAYIADFWGCELRRVKLSS